jgi:hypothetical protein
MDRTVKGLLAQMALYRCSQTVVTFAQINHFGGDVNGHTMQPMDHRAAAIWAMRSGITLASNQTVPQPLITSSVPEWTFGI